MCWKYLLFNIQMCHKYYCAAAWLQQIFFKQTYPPDLHRSNLNLLQVMQNSKNVQVNEPRDKIIKKTIKLCAESIYYSIFKCVTNTTALQRGCSKYFLSKHILPICTVPIWTFFKWCKIQEMWRSMHLVIKFLGVSQCHLVFHCGFVPDTHEIVIPRTLWGRKGWMLGMQINVSLILS